MLGKMILSTVLAIGLSTTAVIAKSNVDQMVKAAYKQEQLSQNIINAYKKQDNGSSALAIIVSLESEHTKLKSNIRNAEIDNLLIYLNICLADLKKVLQKPYSSQNAQLVADLSASLSEGSHYIGQSLKKNT